MSFHSTRTKTLKELQMVNLEKTPTKYILSLYRRTKIHLEQLSKTVNINCYNDYLYNNDGFYEENHTVEEKEYITLRNYLSDLKTTLDKKEHLKRKTC